MTGKSKFIFIVVFVVAVAAVFYFGRWTGQSQKQEVIETKFQPLVDLAFRKPPEVINSFEGVVKNIAGATIELEIQDPDDYLPHTDGSPNKTQIRFASITSKTSITLVEPRKIKNDGRPTITPIKLSDLKPGDGITVVSDQNIRDAQKFDVTEIELVRY